MAIVLSVLLVAFGSFAFLLTASPRWLANRALLRRSEAQEALRIGDNSTSLAGLAFYLRVHPLDVGALYEYARARRRVPLADEAQQRDTMAVLERILQLDSHHLGALRDLLSLYEEDGSTADVHTCADKLLEAAAGDVAALRAKKLFAVAQEQARRSAQEASPGTGLSP